MRSLLIFLFFTLVLLSTIVLPSRSIAEELQVDGFVNGQTAHLQLGLGIGDILAVRLVPTGPCPCQVTGVKFLLGTSTGGPLIGEMDIHIWEDAAGLVSPGTELFQGRIAPTSDNNNFFRIDVSPENIIVDGPFRLGLEIVIPEQTIPEIEPSLFRDGDGTLTPQQNFIFDVLSTSWFYSDTFLLPGDWIIRAIVEPPQSTVPALSKWGLAITISAALCLVLAQLARTKFHRRET